MLFLARNFEAQLPVRTRAVNAQRLLSSSRELKNYQPNSRFFCFNFIVELDNNGVAAILDGVSLAADKHKEQRLLCYDCMIHEHNSSKLRTTFDSSSKEGSNSDREKFSNVLLQSHRASTIEASPPPFQGHVSRRDTSAHTTSEARRAPIRINESRAQDARLPQFEKTPLLRNKPTHKVICGNSFISHRIHCTVPLSKPSKSVLRLISQDDAEMVETVDERCTRKIGRIQTQGKKHV